MKADTVTIVTIKNTVVSCNHQFPSLTSWLPCCDPLSAGVVLFFSQDSTHCPLWFLITDHNWFINPTIRYTDLAIKQVVAHQAYQSTASRLVTLITLSGATTTNKVFCSNYISQTLVWKHIYDLRGSGSHQMYAVQCSAASPLGLMDFFKNLHVALANLLDLKFHMQLPWHCFVLIILILNIFLCIVEPDRGALYTHCYLHLELSPLHSGCQGQESEEITHGNMIH